MGSSAAKKRGPGRPAKRVRVVVKERYLARSRCDKHKVRQIARYTYRIIRDGKRTARKEVFCPLCRAETET